MPEQVIEGSDPRLLAEHHIEVETAGLPPGLVRMTVRREQVVMDHALAWAFMEAIGRKIGADIERVQPAPEDPVSDQ